MPTKKKKPSRLKSFRFKNRLRFINFVLIFAIIGVSLLVISMAAPIPGEYGSVEKDQVARINAARTTVPDLFHTECLRIVARDWTLKMANSNVLGHNPNLAADVDSRCGSNWLVVGENVGVGYSSAQIFDAYNASVGHRDNIVSSAYTRVGVGAYWSSNGKLWTTTVFANCYSCSGAWNTTAKPPADPLPPAKWSSWETFGTGTITGDPDVASWGSGRLDVFARGSDNTLRHKAYNSGGWGGWSNKGGNIDSDPTAVSWSSGRIDVFARSSKNTLLHMWYADGSGWSQWQDLGGSIVSAPTVSSWGSGRLDVFARNSSNRLVHKWYSGSNWSGWEDLGGNFEGDPSAASWGSNRIDIVARNSSYQLVHKWFSNGSWSGWENLGGSFVSDPSISARTNGMLDIFARNSSNKLVFKNYSAYGWSTWYTLDGSFVSGPTSESWASDRIDVFARNSSNQLVHKWYSR